MSDLTPEQFTAALTGIRRSAQRLETRRAYVVSAERADLEAFVADRPRPPEEMEWWRPWLDLIARLTSDGKQVTRIRVVDSPPTDYQRFEIFAAPVAAIAGEDIRYLHRATAMATGLPMEHDWWLLDDEQLVVMTFGPAGEVTGRELVTDPGRVEAARHWRDLAARHACAAGELAA